MVLLHDSDLLLQDIVLRQLGLDRLLLGHGLLLLRLDLRLGPSPLAAALQQVGGDPFRGCRWTMDG